MATRAQPGLLRETVKAGAVRSTALFGSIALFVATLLMALALASYQPSDPSLNTASGAAAQNLVGLPGAWFADIALTLFGPAIALLLPVAPIVALRLWRAQPAGQWLRMLRNAAIGVALMATALSFVSSMSVLALPAGWGGLIGLSLSHVAAWALAFADNTLVSTWGMRAIGLVAMVAGIVIWAKSLEIALGDRQWRRRRVARIAYAAAVSDDDAEEIDDEPLTLDRKAVTPRAVAAPDPRPAPVIADRSLAPSAAKPRPKQAQLDLGQTYKLPPIDLLAPPPPTPKGAIDKAALERNARLLENVLDDFHVKGSIIEVRPGPVVTMYE
ncbi:MAG: DNA translocase FtsK, partial [Sphingomonas sp.]